MQTTKQQKEQKASLEKNIVQSMSTTWFLTGWKHARIPPLVSNSSVWIDWKFKNALRNKATLDGW